MHNSTSFPASRGTGGKGTQHLGVSQRTDQVLDPGAGRLSGRQRHLGVIYGGEGSAFSIINRRYYGEGSPGRSFGWELSGAMLGMATGGWISDVLFGFYDHYLLTIALSVTTSLAGASVIMSMDQTDRVLILDWEEGLPPEARSTPVPAAD